MKSEKNWVIRTMVPEAGRKFRITFTMPHSRPLIAGPCPPLCSDRGRWKDRDIQARKGNMNPRVIKMWIFANNGLTEDAETFAEKHGDTVVFSKRI
ncbi:hypothetical protein QUF72_16010 [Desulfobacterales bacterium HSG2]|nr:hypothetical protein [Desulfobacterales bacterium HSG2]